MAINLHGRDFLTLNDFSTDEILYLLTLAKTLKEKRLKGEKTRLLDGKNIVLIFEKPSTRTRCSFEVAAQEESGNVTFLSDSHIGHKESIEDTAKVLSRYYDGIEFRGFKQETVETLACFSDIPVWNGLTDEFHPTQALADFLTIMEHINKPLDQIKIVFVGDNKSNVSCSLMIASQKMGSAFFGLGPKKYFPKNKYNALFSENIEETVKSADVIYTDVWTSMGQENEMAERIKLFKPYQVNLKMLQATENKNVIFMHCLPACHDTQTEVGRYVFEKFGLKAMEVTDDVFRSRHSVVFDQAENRLHTIKAVMVSTL